MSLLIMSALTADSLFPISCAIDVTDIGICIVSPDAAVRLSDHWGLPCAEMEFDVLPLQECIARRASDGGDLVGYVWCEGIKYEMSC